MAYYLGIDVQTMGGMGADVEKIPQINSTCSVFALSEVISHLASGYTNDEIIAGINNAFAERIAQLVPENVEGTLVAIGGPAKNKGMIRALSETLGTKILVPDEPQIVNAAGCVRYWDKKS
jgi:activator of 2-hydroxyglutaryl-CoA dehydratase